MKAKVAKKGGLTMAKVTIIIETQSITTRELEEQCHRLFSAKAVDYLFPDDREVFIVAGEED